MLTGPDAREGARRLKVGRDEAGRSGGGHWGGVDIPQHTHTIRLLKQFDEKNYYRKENAWLCKFSVICPSITLHYINI